MAAKHNAAILIIDDDAYIREMLTLLFESEGMDRIETAVNGAEGLRKLEAFGEPFVVFLDLMMPISSGWDVLDAVDGNPDLKIHRIAVMSASRPDKSELRGYPFLPKPLDLQQVVRFAKGGFKPSGPSTNGHSPMPD
ncbi:MAG TPA: response regulator [Bdellovibrionota bacterium]|jgi:CheY-like chemotaxis protein|nr:response regulator [Bdellovibrionota bacterium]